MATFTLITIPTEPIGSIPRPIDLFERVARSGSDDPNLSPYYEEAVRETVERLTRDPFRYERYAESYLDVTIRYSHVPVKPVDPRIETPEEVRDRVLEASEYIPIEQLGTTDDCGFSPFSHDTSTSRDTAFAKIQALVQGTRLAEKLIGGH